MLWFCLLAGFVASMILLVFAGLVAIEAFFGEECAPYRPRSSVLLLIAVGVGYLAASVGVVAFELAKRLDLEQEQRTAAAKEVGK